MARKVPTKKSPKREGYIYLLAGLVAGILSMADSYLPEDHGGTNMWLGFFAMLFLLPTSIVLIGMGIQSLYKAGRQQQPPKA